MSAIPPRALAGVLPSVTLLKAANLGPFASNSPEHSQPRRGSHATAGPQPEGRPRIDKGVFCGSLRAPILRQGDQAAGRADHRGAAGGAWQRLEAVITDGTDIRAGVDVRPARACRSGRHLCMYAHPVQEGDRAAEPLARRIAVLRSVQIKGVHNRRRPA